MKLSTNGRYGLKAMADLAAHSDVKPVSVMSIAQRQHISDKYLEIMFAALKKSGLVRSVKGSGGGYCLAKSASDISAREILECLEGDLSIVEDDVSDEEPEGLRRCIKENVWNVVTGRIYKVVDSVSLQEIADGKY